MKTILSISLGLYIFIYVFEGVFRYGLNLVGKDPWIFIRDILLLGPLIIIAFQEFMRWKLHPALGIFLFIVIFHGLVMYMNIGSGLAVIYSAKVLMTMVAGAMASQVIFKPNRMILNFFWFLWLATFIGIFLDKYTLVAFPWAGLATHIGDIQVDISHDWDISGEDKRAAGFMRSSIHAAMIGPLLGLVLLYNTRHAVLRLVIAVMTLMVIYWTTQKGSLLAFVILMGVLGVFGKAQISALRVAFFFGVVLAIALPLILPHFEMPHTDAGVFSMTSFYLRVEFMWPSAWEWIASNEAFPLGVGLGGIAGAQRLYDPFRIDYADNIYIFMYANFGVMTYIYLGWIIVKTIQLPNNASRSAAHAMATLVFLMIYGCVLTLLEDQMASLFMGAAIAWLCIEVNQHRAKTPQGPLNLLVKPS